jgi:hypothetical protein
MRSSTPHLAFALVPALLGCGSPPPAVAPSESVASASTPAAPPPREMLRPKAEDRASVVETPESVIEAIRAYRPDLPETETATRAAVRAAARMNLAAARGPLLSVFLALRVSGLKHEPELYRDMNDAMVKLADPAWEPQLIERLDHPITLSTDLTTRRDEVVWQTVSALILGNLRASNAVRPLLRVVLSPGKSNIASTAVNALVQIGKPAIGPATALLRSENAALVGYSKNENSSNVTGDDAPGNAHEHEAVDRAHVGIAAIVLAAIGRPESGPALIEVIARGADRGR